MVHTIIQSSLSASSKHSYRCIKNGCQRQRSSKIERKVPRRELNCVTMYHHKERFMYDTLSNGWCVTKQKDLITIDDEIFRLPNAFYLAAAVDTVQLTLHHATNRRHLHSLPKGSQQHSRPSKPEHKTILRPRRRHRSKSNTPPSRHDILPRYHRTNCHVHTRLLHRWDDQSGIRNVGSHDYFGA